MKLIAKFVIYVKRTHKKNKQKFMRLDLKLENITR